MKFYLDVHQNDPNSPHHGRVNLAHPIWVELDNGHKRPATQSEVMAWNAGIEEAAKDIEAEFESDTFKAAAKIVREAKVVYNGS